MSIFFCFLFLRTELSESLSSWKYGVYLQRSQYPSFFSSSCTGRCHHSWDISFLGPIFVFLLQLGSQFCSQEHTHGLDILIGRWRVVWEDGVALQKVVVRSVQKVGQVHVFGDQHVELGVQLGPRVLLEEYLLLVLLKSIMEFSIMRSSFLNNCLMRSGLSPATFNWVLWLHYHDTGDTFSGVMLRRKYTMDSCSWDSRVLTSSRAAMLISVCGKGIGGTTFCCDVILLPC